MITRVFSRRRTALVRALRTFPDVGSAAKGRRADPHPHRTLQRTPIATHSIRSHAGCSVCSFGAHGGEDVLFPAVAVMLSPWWSHFGGTPIFTVDIPVERYPNTFATPVPTDDLEDLFKEDIPCGSCNKPATLRSLGHANHPNTRGDWPPYYKCVACWQIWVQSCLRARELAGSIRCITCEKHFATIEDFSDYREF